MVFNIGPAYPDVPPEISVFSSSLDRNNLKMLRDILFKHALNITGSPMLLELISALQENISGLPKQTSSRSFDKSTVKDELETEIVTLLVHIDHMRARTQYVKTVKRWTEELNLVGRLVFCNKLILLLLQGDSRSVKEYMVRHKSVNIDVDSQGHPCKEKMMSVLCEKPLVSGDRFADFQVVECQSSMSVKELFEKQKLDELFVDCVQTIKGFK